MEYLKIFNSTPRPSKFGVGVRLLASDKTVPYGFGQWCSLQIKLDDFKDHIKTAKQKLKKRMDMNELDPELFMINEAIKIENEERKAVDEDYIDEMIVVERFRGPEYEF